MSVLRLADSGVQDKSKVAWRPKLLLGMLPAGLADNVLSDYLWARAVLLIGALL